VLQAAIDEQGPYCQPFPGIREITPLSGCAPEASNHIPIRRFVRDELSAEEKQTAEEHLKKCGRCQAALSAEEQRRKEGRAESSGSADNRRKNRRLSRVLKPRVPSSLKRMRRFLGRFGLVLGLTIGTLFVPTPEGLSPEGVSLPIAALMVPVAEVALGVATTPQAFETFSRPVVFLILASLFLAEALRKHGLTRRLALSTIVASGGGTGKLLFGIMGISALFSMWVGNTATAAMLIPVAITISKQAPDKKAAAILLGMLALGVAYSASLGGMVTILGAAANAVASGFLANIGSWTFVDWMMYGLPSFVVIFPLTWWLLVRLIRLPFTELNIEPAREQVAAMGSMSRKEKEVVGVLVGAAVLWVGGPFVEPLLGLPPTLFSSALVAVMAVSYLAVRSIIGWEDVKGVSWGIFLIIGAGLSLGESLSRTGVTEWFSTLIAPLVVGPPMVVTLLLLVLISALLTNLLNNTTIAAVFVPVLITLCGDLPGVEPVQLVIPVTLATTFGYSLPSASGRMALIAATGIVSKGDMMRYGLIVTVISSVVLALLFYGLTAAGLI